MKWLWTVALLLFVLASCSPSPTQPAIAPAPINAEMPNLASAFCEEQGNKLEIRTAADGSQSGVCIFPDGSNCDEWAYFRGECGPIDQAESSSPTEIATSMPIDPADYEQGWWTYTYAVYGFSIMLPEDWIVEETTTSDPLMSGHMLSLRPNNDFDKENIRLTFRRAGEDLHLWPTGVGQGEFISQGTLDIAGQPARRVLLVCPSGEVTAIWYHNAEEDQPNIARGGLEFGFIYSVGSHCEPGQSLGGKIQRRGEMIVASLKAP